MAMQLADYSVSAENFSENSPAQTVSEVRAEIARLLSVLDLELNDTLREMVQSRLDNRRNVLAAVLLSEDPSVWGRHAEVRKRLLRGAAPDHVVSSHDLRTLFGR